MASAGYEPALYVYRSIRVRIVSPDYFSNSLASNVDHPSTSVDVWIGVQRRTGTDVAKDSHVPNILIRAAVFLDSANYIGFPLIDLLVPLRL